MDARRLVLLAFAGFVLIAGVNFVAVRFSNRELDPFWGAGLRFGVAALLFLALALALRRPFPRGRAALAAVVYGVLSFGAFYALVYYALVRAPAGVAAIAIALAPLATMLLASVQRLESLRPAALGGALLAALGIAVAFWEQVSADVPALSLAALVLAVVVMAQTSILVKRAPKVDPLAMNAVGMLVGAALLLALSRFAGETWALPRTAQARVAVAYLIVVGGLVMFFLYLHVLGSWTASATSYQAVLSPVVTLGAAALLARERPGPLLLAGAALVAAGVYLGAIRPAQRARIPPPRA